MIRTIESIQKDIADTVCEIQELRRAQGPTWDDPGSPTKRIHELTLRLDALYAEKRAAQAPALVAGLPDAEGRRPRKTTVDLARRLFRSQPATN